MPGRTKDHHAMALDEKRLAGLGVAPQTIRSLPKFECPEPRQLDRLVLQNGLSDLLYHEIKSLANSLPWKIGINFPSKYCLAKARFAGTEPFSGVPHLVTKRGVFWGIASPTFPEP